MMQVFFWQLSDFHHPPPTNLNGWVFRAIVHRTASITELSSWFVFCGVHWNCTKSSNESVNQSLPDSRKDMRWSDRNFKVRCVIFGYFDMKQRHEVALDCSTISLTHPLPTLPVNFGSLLTPRYFTHFLLSWFVWGNANSHPKSTKANKK